MSNPEYISLHTLWPPFLPLLGKQLSEPCRSFLFIASQFMKSWVYWLWWTKVIFSFYLDRSRYCLTLVNVLKSTHATISKIHCRMLEGARGICSLPPETDHRKKSSLMSPSKHGAQEQETDWYTLVKRGSATTRKTMRHIALTMGLLKEEPVCLRLSAGRKRNSSFSGGRENTLEIFSIFCSHSYIMGRKHGSVSNSSSRYKST